MYNAGLILEGGGMRATYTTGVIDFFLDKRIDFKNIYAVSAGAGHCLSYLSRQRGRAYRATADYVGDKRFLSLKSLLTTGNLFGVDMVYREIPDKLLPFDYEQYKRSLSTLYAVVTNCDTGEAEYIQVKDAKPQMDVVIASASMPMAAKMVEIDGKKYLDGGIADSIPLKKSIEDGNEKNIAVLTQHAQYVKEPSGAGWLVKRAYKGYPQLVKAIENRHNDYNAAMRYVEDMERAGKVFVIRPRAPLGLSRTEKNKTKLRAVYNAGYDDALSLYSKMMAYLRG